jgi:hypothetical protein
MPACSHGTGCLLLMLGTTIVVVNNNLSLPSTTR